MKIIFFCMGHKNITAHHKISLEFTKDKDISIDGDCIIGVDATFDLEKIKPLLEYEKGRITIETKNHKHSYLFNINKGFNDNKELIIRMSNHTSPRTLGYYADCSSRFLPAELKENLRYPNKIKVTLENETA